MVMSKYDEQEEFKREVANILYEYDIPVIEFQAMVNDQEFWL